MPASGLRVMLQAMPSPSTSEREAELRGPRLSPRHRSADGKLPRQEKEGVVRRFIGTANGVLFGRSRSKRHRLAMEVSAPEAPPFEPSLETTA